MGLDSATMTKNELIDRLENVTAIAALFVASGHALTHQAVSKWPGDKPIPELRRLQLEKMKPHWFRKRRADK